MMEEKQMQLLQMGSIYIDHRESGHHKTNKQTKNTLRNFICKWNTFSFQDLSGKTKPLRMETVAPKCWTKDQS